MFSNPEQNVAKLFLKEGMRVADFGAGSGFYTKALVNHVGYTGKVYVVEIQKDLLGRVKNELCDAGVSNVECIVGDIEKKGGTKIADKTMDAVVASNVLFQVEDRVGFVDEIKRVLKDKGKVLLIDWQDSPDKDIATPKRAIPKSDAEKLFISRGFKVLENVSAGDHHYGIIFEYEG